MPALVHHPTSDTNGSGRIHGLDALRAILMLLGVALHTMLNYLPIPRGQGWGFRDPTAQADWAFAVLDFIHLFRMPAFFVISGFFGALLWYKRGAIKMLKNRVARIMWPFLVFVFLLSPAVIFSFGLGARILDGHLEPVSSALFSPISPFSPPRDTMHLWFLYHLGWITFIATSAVALMERKNFARPGWLGKIRHAAECPWRSLGVFGALNVLWFGFMGWNDLPTSTTWFPNLTILFYYFVCYSMGWLFFTARVDLSNLKHRAWTFIGLGMGCTLLRMMSAPLVDGETFGDTITSAEAIFFGNWIRRITAGLGLVLLTRGFSGLFIRYASAQSYAWRYISDSSYWVYLIHLPLSAFFPALIVGWDAPVLVKWCVAMFLVASTCFATYDLFVRNSFVGSFLNGRRYRPYALKLSAAATLILVCGVSYGFHAIPPPDERTSNWLKGATAAELLPDETITQPTLVGTPPAEASLTRCIQVRAYVICTDALSLPSAHQACEAFGARLLVLNDEAESDEVSKLFWALTKRSFRLGITDKDEEGTWRTYQENAELEFTAWHDHQPDNYAGKEDCAVGNWREKGKWNDISCRWRGGFVCEMADVEPSDKIP